MDDWELLRDYCRGSEPAFAELVRRHLNAVYSTALRRVGHSETARDVCHRVFTLLAQKAATLQSTGSLLGWLHRAAVHISSEIQRTERRRHAREQEVSHLNAMTSDPGSDDAWQQLTPQLDTALLELSEVDRQAVLLRFFERLPLAEVGRRLGTSEAAAKMRVGRAVTRLREQLGLQGVVLTGGVLMGLLAERTVVAAPAGFADGILAAALSKTGTGVSTFGTGLATLSRLALPLAGVATVVVLGTLGLSAFQNYSGTVVPPDQELVSSPSGLSSAGQNASEGGANDPLEDPAILDQAIARLREVIRTPFNRKIPTDQVQEAVNALGRHAPKALPMVLEELTAAMDVKASKAPAEVQQKLQIQSVAVETLRSMGRSAHEALPQVMEWYRAGKLAWFNDKVPTLLIALEPSLDQSRELIEYIAQTSGPNSYIPETVLQLTELHPELLPETLQLLGDRLSQIEGDHLLVLARTLAKLPGSNPEQLRPIFEQFLMLPELRDPTHYQAKFENGTHEVWRITQRGFDDAKRHGAAAALASLGDAGRESLPALAELAQRTTNEQLRDQVFRSIAELDPERRFESPELTAARKGWDQDQAFFDQVKFGTASLEDLRLGLTRSRSAGAAAALLAQRGDEARELAPELVAALTRTGSYEVAQALKTLAPEQLVQCLKNPAAFTLVEDYEFKAHPERQALVEAAQALAELGPEASFALPALKEALEIPDREFVRLTLDETIRAIDPQAPQSVFRGNSISALSSALITARDDAESAGNPDQARLADTTAGRLELNYGMTRSELLAIDAELQAADPALHRIYREALVRAIPQLQPAQVASP